MDQPVEVQVKDLPGLVATVVTTGRVYPQFSQNLMELRAHNIEQGFTKIEYRMFDAKLVEAGRDAIAHHALKEKYEWVLQIDADAAPFAPDSLLRLLHTAYIKVPQVDVVGAYCQLKGDVPLPTIDTGTGTWEEWYPNQGVVPVIRTGAHFLLCKTQAFRKMGKPPWFRSRHLPTPVQAMADVDNFARTQMDGRNPLVGQDWQTLVNSAAEYSKNMGRASVGEDSGFCDRLRFCGGIIVVDTDIAAGHVGEKMYVPDDLRKAMEERDMKIKRACGLLE